MSADKFQIVGDNLSGRGLSFDVATLVTSEQKGNAAERGKRLAEIAEVAFLQGRTSLLLSFDDRWDLHCSAEILRALAVVVGPSPTGDRHRRAADVIARLLQAQEGGT